MTENELLEQDLIRYAGRNYAEPREVQIGEMDFYDDEVDLDHVLATLTEFKAKHRDATRFRFGFGEYGFSVTARRKETPDETAARIEGYRSEVRGRLLQRRAEYERMKREFGDA